MGKIRHIAYRVADVEKMAEFFVDALEMSLTQRRKNGAIDLSDGSINITLLPKQKTGPNGEPAHQGIDHIGFSVENDEHAARRLEKAGAKEAGRIDLGGAAYFEKKYQGPENIIVDIGHWIGTEPIEG